MIFFQAFNEFDVDGGGNISTKELGWAMRAMGMNPTENALLELINEVKTAQNQTKSSIENVTENTTECPTKILLKIPLKTPMKIQLIHTIPLLVEITDKITLATSSL